LSLSNNGGPNLLTSAQTLATNDNQTFTLGNLTLLTGGGGNFTLTPARRDQRPGRNAMPLGASASFSVVIDNTPPTAAITPISSPTNVPIGQMTITFQ